MIVAVVAEALVPLCCDVAGLAPPAAGVDALVEGAAELPHAASRTAPPARIGAAHHRLRIATSPFLVA
jgi:hypothetical protein